LEKLVSLCKRRGFVFQSSEIYGGLGSTWDYGPLGVELKNNVKAAWWRAMVRERDDIVGLDAAILMHPQTWVASGHVASFADPMVECKKCHERFRPDQVTVWEVHGPPPKLAVLGYLAEHNAKKISDSQLAMQAARILSKHGYSGGGIQSEVVKRSYEEFINNVPTSLPCPFCDTAGQFTEPRTFNLMFKTFMGPVEDSAHTVYMRPETAQGIFVNFQNVATALRRKVPFGIAQIGKSFRNEITPGNFVFRTREFEQMELEFFVKPSTDDDWLQRWVQERFNWYKRLGMREENLRLRQHERDELAHYAKACYDIEYHFPWGWAELEGIANRTDFDLKSHAESSGKDLKYFDDETKEHYYPYVIEPSGGVDRALLAFLADAYGEEPDPGQREMRTVLRLSKELAPIKVAVLPLSRNEKLVPTAREVYTLLRPNFMTQYDDAQSIGRRYRRQDEIGTLYCVTVDFQTVEQDQAVTIRDRDSMQQIRIPISNLVATLKEKLDKGW
jgi:glycyl-tRNA synthetase